MRASWKKVKWSEWSWKASDEDEDKDWLPSRTLEHWMRICAYNKIVLRFKLPLTTGKSLTYVISRERMRAMRIYFRLFCSDWGTLTCTFTYHPHSAYSTHRSLWLGSTGLRWQGSETEKLASSRDAFVLTFFLVFFVFLYLCMCQICMAGE